MNAMCAFGIYFFIYGLSCLPVLAVSDTVSLHELHHPAVEIKDSGRTLNIQLKRPAAQLTFHITAQAKTALVVNGELLHYWNDPAIFELSPAHYAAMAFPLEIILEYPVASRMPRIAVSGVRSLSFPQESLAQWRPRSVQGDFFISTLLFCLFGGAVMWYVFPTTSNELYSFPRFFTVTASESLEQSGGGGTGIQLLFFLFLALFISAFAVHFYDELALQPSWFTQPPATSPWIYWLVFSGFLMFYWLFKYVLIRVTGNVFNIGNLTGIHFYDYARFSFLFFTGMGLLFLITYVASSYTWQLPFELLVWALIFMFTARTFFLFFKLLRVTHFSFVHLFLYLCATELTLGLLVLRVFF